MMIEARDFHRVVLADRGSAATRFIHAARELDAPLSTVALFTDADRRAMFVREADDAVHLDGDLDLARLEQAIFASGAGAVWVGWGLALSHLAVAELCERRGVVFIGPSAAATRRLEDPSAARRLADEAGLPGHHGSIGGARRLEVQILGDRHGNAWALGVRDGTILLRGRSVLVEAPSPALSPAEDASIRAAAARLARLAGYDGAGTVELLFDPGSRRAFFLGLRAGFPLAHAVTEMTTGLDLVKLQIHVARGGRLEGEPPAPRGHAVFVRVSAEDPERGFAPAPGRVELLRLPTGPGLRVDAGVAEGDEIGPDGTIAGLSAGGSDRAEALGRLRRALRESALALRGGATDKAFLLGLLGRPEVSLARTDDAWLDGLVVRGEHVPREHASGAILAAAIEIYAAERAVERAQFFASAARGRPRVRPEGGRGVELRHQGRAYRLLVQQLGPSAYRVDGGGGGGGGVIDLEVERLGPFERRLSYGGRRFHAFSVAHGTSHLIEIDGIAHRVTRDAGGLVRAPTPAMVLSVPVAPGQEVAAGDPVAVLEAMKMEMAVSAPFAGRVREVLVTSNVQVDAGAPLVLLDPLGAEGERPAPVLLHVDAQLEPWSSDARARWARAFDEIHRLMLGFDLDAAAARRVAAQWIKVSGDLPPADHRLLRAEERILSAFADVHALFGRQASPGDPDGSGDRSAHEHFVTYLRAPSARGEGLPAAFLDRLSRALAHYGVHGLERTPELEDALVRIYEAHDRGELHAAAVVGTLERWLAHLAPPEDTTGGDLRRLLDRLILVTQGRFPVINDLAREVRYRCFDQPIFERARGAVHAEVERSLAHLAADPARADRDAGVAALVECAQPIVGALLDRFEGAAPAFRALMLEVLTRRYYRIRDLDGLAFREVSGRGVALGAYDHEGRRVHVVATHARRERFAEDVGALAGLVADVPADHDVVLDLYAWGAAPLGEPDATLRELREALGRAALPRALRRIVVVAGGPEKGRGAVGIQHFTFRPAEGGLREEALYRGLHPMMGKRMHLWQLENFTLERLPSVEDVYLFHARARDNPRDERLLAVAEIRDLTPAREADGRIAGLPNLERMLQETLAGIRVFQARRAPHERLQYNRVLLHVLPPFTVARKVLDDVVRRLAPGAEGLGIEQVKVCARMPDTRTGELRERVIRISTTVGRRFRVTFGEPSAAPIPSLSEYEQKVAALRRRGLVYPYEIIKLLTPARSGGAAGDFPPGEFVEHDLDASGALVPVDRPHGKNTAHLVVGVIKNTTALHPEGMTRVVLLGDPSKEMGSVAEPECRRIAAALDLAERLSVPVDWFTLSAGAKISMQSGTENMDWVSLVLRRIIELTQRGLTINVIVCGINVGAQPYWNAEATMLMHTRGILVMTSEAAMVLTGKQALDYSGSVSADDNQGIGGYDRIMGPNGQAQYWAEDIGEACRVLMAHHEHAYVVPGERFPRRAPTSDPIDRDIRAMPHPAAAEAFATVGDVFSDEKNPGRKKPFEIRAVMLAVADQDHRPLERWAEMRDAETAVVWDARLGGYPVCLIGIESRPLRRLGFLPADGPDRWTSGTLFPRSSKKVARAINAASHNRPVVVLANLSGFDGSPDSMRNLQLEYGAEIGRAVVNFRGPIVFAVVSRYHGGAFVVFSKRLNDGLESVALEGSYASVIGGAPAAAVVFAREVDARTGKDPRVIALEGEVAGARGDEKRRLAGRLGDLRALVRSEKLGEVAEGFDRVHSVERAREVGSLDRILPAARLRPYLVEAIERGIARALGEE
jgi:acetyl/propionyl-CoA carboxylase alpha subunit/acetyl-CoA carboxylase carboxyltransferase component